MREKNNKYDNTLLEYINSYNNVSNEFEVLFEKNNSEEINDDTLTFNLDLNSNLYSIQDNLEIPKEKVLGNIQTNNQHNMIKLMKLVRVMNCPDYVMKGIIIWAREAFLDGFGFN